MGETPAAFLRKKSKRWQKYVDYRKRFKYSVSDGNPLSYYNGADYTFTWEQGRQLASVTKGNKTASYTYDMSGVRSSKTVNGVSYEYTTLSGKLMRQTWSGNELQFVYDASGRPYLLRYTPSGGATQTYYYVLNLQGDVVGLMNGSGEMAVRYSYDPWGKPTGTTASSAYAAVAEANPLRYRSYYYDAETGFYYLQSRYYDPAIARFINADGYLTTDALGLLSGNMFAYCENDPVMCIDSTGEFLGEIWEFIKTTISEIGNAIGLMSPAYAGCAGAGVADGPLPFGDVFAIAGATLISAGAIGYGAYRAAKESNMSIPKAKDKAEVVPAPPTTPTVIYRYGGTNPGNLTPRAKDMYSGLSFSTVPIPGAAMTTIEALNATGVVYAVKDGVTHVSVRPVGGTMKDWINAGSGSVWTQAVKSVVVRWDGG